MRANFLELRLNIDLLAIFQLEELELVRQTSRLNNAMHVDVSIRHKPTFICLNKPCSVLLCSFCIATLAMNQCIM